ncbi:MAG TPA: proteasome activator, partial [Acidimicrobiales bacterium]
MSNDNGGETPDEGVEHPDLIIAAGGEHSAEPSDVESVEQPAKVMRIGSMVKQLLDEVRAAPLDDRSRARMAEIFQLSVEQLADALSPDLQEELRAMAPPFDS